jgi:hypothetical protein
MYQTRVELACGARNVFQQSKPQARSRCYLQEELLGRFDTLTRRHACLSHERDSVPKNDSQRPRLARFGAAVGQEGFLGVHAPMCRLIDLRGVKARKRAGGIIAVRRWKLGARFGKNLPHTSCYTYSVPERDLAISLALRLYDVGGWHESFSRGASRVAWNAVYAVA